MSYKGTGAMTDNNSLWVDKNMVVHYDGNPKLAEEYNERVLLGFQSLSATEKSSYAAKLKNALSGRAWTLVHKRPEISAEKLIQLSASEPSSTSGPLAAVTLLVKTVRQSCERVAPLLKNQVFEEYFFTKGLRRSNEPIQDYIQRRQNEYDRLQSLTQGHTKLSVDLQTFFLLRNSGCSSQQQKAILGQAGNEYDWDRVVEAMLIQLDQDDGSRSYGNSWKGSQKGKGGSSYAGSRSSWTFPAEEEWYDGYDEEASSYAYDAEGEDESQWYDAWPSSPEHQDDEAGDHVYEDLEELEHSFDVLAFDEMSQTEIDAFAFEAQRLAKNASEYVKKRKMVRDGKSNRGFSQGLQHNRTAISIDGKLSLNGEQLGSKLASIKSKSRCFACNGIGHWEGDRQCPKFGSSKGGKGGKSKKGRKGGFLQRAGVAAAMIASAAGTCIFPPPTPTDVMMLEPTLSSEATIPWSVQILSAQSSGRQSNGSPVPLGFAVIDTAALLGCGGDQAVDAFIKKFKVEDCRSPLIKIFKGVNSGAPITSVEEQWLSIGLASRDAHVSIHRLPNSTVPILFGLPQLKALGAKISLDGHEPFVIFQKVSNRKIPLQYGRAGHLLLNIADWNSVNEVKATVSTKEIEVFALHERKAGSTGNGGHQRILHRKERLKIQQWVQEAKREGEAIWKELKKGQRNGQLQVVKELYCGADGGAVSKEARMKEVAIGRPYDLLMGDDLLDAEQQHRVLEEIRKEQPFLVIIAFPCTAWSSLSNFKPGEQRMREQLQASQHLRFVRRVCALQVEAGRHYLLENPASSQAWKWMPWLEELPHTTITMHQCQTNLKDEKGDFILKPTRFVTSAPHLAEHLILKCSYDHPHGQVQGRGQDVSKSLATWTPELAQRILEGVTRQLKHENVGGDPFHYDQFHVHDEIEVLAAEGGLRRSADVIMREMEGDDFNQWEEVPAMLRSAIVKIHQQYSHSLIGEDLARHLRLGGASEKAIKAARLLKCQRCEAEKRSVPRPVAAVPKYEHFNQCVAMDIAFLPCLRDVQHAFLVMVDQATHYVVAAYIMSAEGPGRPIKPDALSVKNAFVNWVEMFGKPDRVQIDQDSAFRKGFKQVLDLFMIDDVMVPRDAHWSHGVVERRILTLKEMIVKVVPEFEAKGNIMMRVVVSQCTHTLNRLCNNRGFSPAQCVLGANPKLPEVLAGNTMEDSPHIEERPLAMAQRLDLIRMCEESFVKANHSATLKRAILSQVRKQPGPFEQHSLVMYRRRDPLKHLLHRQWHGPARVIGRDEMGYWLIHRGFPVLAHPNNMRKMVADEIAQSEVPSLGNGPKGQKGFIDVSKPIEDELDGEEGQHPDEVQQDLDDFEREIQQGPMSKRAKVTEEEAQELEYFPESPLAHDEDENKVIPFSSGFSGDENQLPPPEPEEDDGRGYRRDLSDVDDDASDSQRRFHKIKPSISKSAKRRLRRRRQNLPSQPVVVEQDPELYQRNVISDFQAQSSEDRKKRVLDDMPHAALKQLWERERTDQDVHTPPVDEEDQPRRDGHDGSDHRGEGHRDKRAKHGPYYVYSFLSERCDEYVKKNKHTELHPHKILSQLPQWDEKVINDAMQKAANKEIDTWLDFDAVDIISPKEGSVIMKENPEKVIDSRAVWTEKDGENGNLVLKCRIVGKGFQEMYDDKLRRDSPTCSQLLVNLVCSLASSKKMKLKAGDVKGAFLQGVKIDRELYFRMPRNMGNVKLKHTEPGSLFLLKKAIYGVNDAARKWYMSLRTILMEIGWKSLTFENAGFVLRDDKTNKVIAIMALHVDDILIAMDEENFPEECEKMQKLLQSKIQWGSWRDCMEERVKFCGRHYRQDQSFSVEIDSDDYIESMSTYRVSREKMKNPEVDLEPHELRAFRGLLGQLQWYARIAGYDVGFSISQLAGRLKEPKIKDLSEASRLIKQIKTNHLGRKILFDSRVQYDSQDVAVIAVHDASFNNVANHGSQRGCWIGVTTKKMIDDHGSKHGVHFLQWSTGRIQRVVRSTLSAEAYSCSEAIDQLNWLRGTITELMMPSDQIRDYSKNLSEIPGVVVTDCKSLYDCLHGERTLLSDKRLSLEAAIIRQGLQENVTVKWVCSEQQLADCLTKQLNGRSLEYIQLVLGENTYTLGPDVRTGKTRREEARKRKENHKVNDEQQATEMNQKPVKTSKATDGLCNNLLLTIAASSVTMGQSARLDVGTTAEGEFSQVLSSVLAWILNTSCHWLTIAILVCFAGGVISFQVYKNWGDLSFELQSMNRVNQWGVVALLSWLFTTLIHYGVMSGFSPNSQFYGPHFVGQLTLTLTIAWYFKQWFLAKFKFTWRNADLKQRQTKDTATLVKGEMMEFLRDMETRMKGSLSNEMQLRTDAVLNYMGAFQNTMVFRTTVISQELSAQYATMTRSVRRTEEKVEAVDARIKLIHDVILDMLRVPADEAETSLFRQIDARLEARLRRIDLTGTPTVSGDDDDPMSGDEAEENESDQNERLDGEDEEVQEGEEENSQQSERSHDPSEYINGLIQRYRQAATDGDQALADELEREIFERWINLA